MMLDKIVDWIVKNTKLSLFIAVAVILLTSIGAQHLTMDFNYRRILGKKELAELVNLDNTYQKEESVFIVLAPKDKNIFSKESLSSLKKLTDKSWGIPDAYRVDSITNFQYSFSKEDELFVGDLVKNTDDLNANKITQIKKIVMTDPRVKGSLISQDGSIAGVYVSTIVKNPDILPKLGDYVREIRDEIEKENPNVEVYLSGTALLSETLLNLALGDMGTLIPIMNFVLFLVFWFMFRSLIIASLSMLVVGLSVAGGMGLAGWMGIEISSPVALAPNVILTIAVADIVHLVLIFLQNWKNGVSKDEAIKISLKLNLKPILLTSLTTIIGFLSINFNESPPFRDLGNAVAGGAAVALLLVIFLLPVLLMKVPFKKPKDSKNRIDNEKHFEKYSEFLVNNKNKILITSIATVILTGFFIQKNIITDDYVKFFDKGVEFRDDTDYINKNFVSYSTVDYSFPAKGTEGVTDPQYLNDIDKFVTWYREQPEVAYVRSITDTLKTLNKNFHNDDPEKYSLPITKELAGQYLLLYELSLPQGLDLRNILSVDKAFAKVTIGTYEIDAKDMVSLDQRAMGWLKENTKLKNVSGSGPTFNMMKLTLRNTRSMIESTCMALMLVSLILLFFVRSLKISLISLVPNLVPAVIGFGVWGILYGRIGLALSAVIGVTLGIVVDDTIHFLLSYQKEKKNGGSEEDAVKYAIRHVGPSIATTTIILIVGFSVLAMSNFTINSHMGIMVSLILFFALIFDLTLLPTILLFFGKKEAK